MENPKTSDFFIPLLSHMKKEYSVQNFWGLLRSNLLTYNIQMQYASDEVYDILRFSKGCYVIAAYVLGIELGCISPSDKDFVDEILVQKIRDMAENIPWMDKVLILNTALDICEIQNLEGKIVGNELFKNHMMGYYDTDIRLAFNQGWFSMSDFYNPQTDLN